MITDSLLADLHSHTTASDGVLTPAELVERAIDKGVQMLAITDHDTVAGLAEAHQYNNQHSTPLKLINGVEISTRWNNFDIHIVGLNLDITDAALLAFLTNQRELREQRAKDIGIRLAKAGIEGAYEGAQKFAAGAAISRGHYARWLAEKGYAKDMPSVFKRYLARNKTGYVPNNWGDMASAINIIHRSGGVAVLAHPSGYKLSAKWLKKLVREYKEAGGDAMEVVLGQQSIDDRANLVALSHLNNLMGSIGSDFHFPSNWIELGKNLFQPAGIQWVWQAESWTERT
ncbi:MULTISPECIES: PHP domain-containing protein [unclassified Shewanella]|uniref:RNase RNM n=1 Tax=unclassified Shewanella TaxID=196818 RepID=UPI000C844017|nr:MULTISPECIES: PHP domain-containing protein [unclassified Shewanella]MDO6639066.1 PHP domain-containing protein [Shewanella sp. 5_MG-2023]MDO6677600.1 PHP domain-containing protein [Shewanella sp. 4_MG-2023]PMG28072.1 phosphatase [Shewanella sp. 10N.286.52.C2]PMG42020.1 phosphatase [Shewanella sp. 10N.286.52.B9]PMH87510.1 phosphatase [Shewanella sp. 10N.286.48.B5]